MTFIFHEYLSSINDLLVFIIEKQLLMNYPVNDTREAFFRKILHVGLIYYCNIASMLIGDTSIIPAPNKSEKEIEHLQKLLTYFSDQGFRDMYWTPLKTQLIMDSWVCFESSLDAIYRAIVPIEIREKHELKNYMEVAKIIKSLEADENTHNKLKKQLRGEHVSINDKYNTIFTIIKANYPKNRSISQDREFLDCFGMYRNTTHNNTIALKDRSFNTKIGNFEFRKGEAAEFFPEIVLKLVKELVEVYSAICLSMSYQEMIIDPYSLWYQQNSNHNQKDNT